MTTELRRLGIILIFIAIVGPALWSVFPYRQNWDIDWVVSATAFAIGIVTFFGVTTLNYTGEDQPAFDDARLRTAIACSLVLTYLFMVCFTTFVRNAPTVGRVTEAFVQSFSNVVSVTIAFYFGASAATQVFGREKSKESKPRERKSPEDEK